MKCHSQNSLSKLMSLGNELRRSSTVTYLPEPLRGLSVTQMIAMIYISDHEEEGVFQKDVEGYLRIRRSSVSTLLNNLEKARLILRVPVPEDARLKKLTLTEEGKKSCCVIEFFHEEIEKFMQTILTSTELEMFTNILEKIMNNIDAYREAYPEGSTPWSRAEKKP